MRFHHYLTSYCTLVMWLRERKISRLNTAFTQSCVWYLHTYVYAYIYWKLWTGWMVTLECVWIRISRPDNYHIYIHIYIYKGPNFCYYHTNVVFICYSIKLVFIIEICGKVHFKELNYICWKRMNLKISERLLESHNSIKYGKHYKQWEWTQTPRKIC